MKNNIKYITYSIVLALLLTGIVFLVINNESRKIQSIDVVVKNTDRLKFINIEEVKLLVTNTHNKILDKSRRDVDLLKIEKEIVKQNVIQNVEVSFSLDGVLSVNVDQREPIGRIVVGKWHSYIDETGKVMPLTRKFTARVPLVTGYVVEENLSEVYEVLKYVHEDKILKNLISGVTVDKLNNFELRTIHGNQIIELGKIEEVDVKVKKLIDFYRYTVTKYGWAKYKRINLKFANQVVCTKR
ncbi:MAG: hypothetical protein KAG96_03585 [Ichthyobacteriaceae bacterium]|nr:hypothetical protein [Ichthyobacteriaceae bacterium]